MYGRYGTWCSRRNVNFNINLQLLSSFAFRLGKNTRYSYFPKKLCDMDPSIRKKIIVDFSSLWDFQEFESTLEISTPIVMSSGDFVSVFLTKHEDKYIASDGGWIFAGEYDSDFDLNEAPYDVMLHHFEQVYHTERMNFNDGLHFCKSTNKSGLISSIVYDLTFFIRDVVSIGENLNIMKALI